ncbi:MAG: N-acetylmuramoyl-L-alanine amidase [Micropruina sp.]|uniref:N-acetylmuramoyl-L-alanine amidase n=1 Tax=Micropruina sp. TaxID=2737536 RepID=UPI0039E61C5A
MAAVPQRPGPAGRSRAVRNALSSAALVLVAGLIGGCATSSPELAAPRPQPSVTATVQATTAPAKDEKPLAGRTIVVDPGHNGKYQKSFNTKKVPAGNGKKKACNSSGTTGKKLTEHAYNWAQAGLLKAELERRGATVLLTRKNDAGLGPCVDKRAKVANDAKAGLLISIHADGSYAAKARGFHIIVSTTMAGGSGLEKTSQKLAKLARTELAAHTAMPRSTYIGRGTALSSRSDIATLNLLTATPGIMMEMGNMRHSKDLTLLKSKAFRLQVAQALADAAQSLLNG